MTAAIVELMPRSQVIAKDAGLIAATQDAPGALTAEQCAMYRQVLNTLRHADMLATKAILGEQSHNLLWLQRELEATRAQIGRTAYRLYEIVARAPDSKFLAAREERADLIAELTLIVCRQAS